MAETRSAEEIRQSIEANRAEPSNLALGADELALLRNTLRQVAAVCRFWPALLDFARAERPLDRVLQPLS